MTLRQKRPRRIPLTDWWTGHRRKLRGIPTQTVNISRTINETMSLQDGGAQDFNDPDGLMQETASDGTVWTVRFPPFHKRTRWS